MSTPAPSDLLFRRQYIIGPEPVEITADWSSRKISDEYVLSSHPDLDVTSAQFGDNNLFLLGFAVDSHHPDRNEDDILAAVDGTDLSSVIESTKPLCGRWVVVFVCENDISLFTDPCGFRQAYYYTGDDRLWCASQPELIREARELTFTREKELLDFLYAPALSANNSAWIGNRTPYKQCFHLLPNHFLSFNDRASTRFFPDSAIPTRPVDAVVDEVATMLQNTMRASTQRRPLHLALTAGVDSRTILAASRGVTDRITCYIDRLGKHPEHYPDVQVPKQICNDLDILFEVRNSNLDPPGWLSTLMSRSVTGARFTPAARDVYSSLLWGDSWVSVNGNASEIHKGYYEVASFQRDKPAAAEYLASALGYRRLSFAKQELERWLSRLPALSQAHTLDLLYWEQKLGNWGARRFSETQIAYEHISPFNNRALIETLLTVPRTGKTGEPPTLHRKLMEQMWPELLRYPINPPSTQTAPSPTWREALTPLAKKVLPRWARNWINTWPRT